MAGFPRMFSTALIAIVLVESRRQDWTHGRAKSLSIASSDFVRSTKGWTLEVTESSEQLSDPSLQRTALQAADLGSSLWYFVAPSEFSGNFLAAYNGAIYFKHWHSQQPKPGSLPSTRILNAPDVVIETHCGFDLLLSNFTVPTITPRVYYIPLYEQATNWIDSRTQRRVQQLDLIEALSHFKSLKIRGGFFVGPETVLLADVRIVPASDEEFSGRSIRPCCSPDGLVVPCNVEGHPSVPGASRYAYSSTPPSLQQFECGGSRLAASRRPSIKNVFPKVSRKSGGTKITVLGENFGLDGSSVLRIGSRDATNCQFFAAEHCSNAAIDFDEENVDCGGRNCAPCTHVVPHCQSGVLDADEDKLDCGGLGCAACDTVNLTAHCTNGVMDFDEEAPDMGGADCLPPFCFDSRLAGDKTDVDNNCGGSCQPCYPIQYLDRSLHNGEFEMAVCDAPPERTDGDSDDGPSFVRRDQEREFVSCGYDDVATRGFVYGGYDAEWAVHWASLEDTVMNDVNVTNIGVDVHSGDVYVTATVTKVQDESTGRNGAMGRHMHRGAWYEPGFGGVGSEDEVILDNEAQGNAFDTDITYTAMLKLDKLGRVAWLTYLESQYALVATDIVVDSMAATRRIILVGHFKGNAPRFYQVNPLTRKARRGPSYNDGVLCPNPDAVEDLSGCHYLEAEAIYGSPFDQSASTQQLGKVGLFLVAYTPDGVATACQGSMYFLGTSSYINTNTIRIAAHSTAPPAPGENGTVGIGLEGSSGLYLAFQAAVSRYGDTLYLAEQALGYQYLNPCKGGAMQTLWAGLPNATESCVGGVNHDRDVLSVRFAAVVPTPDLELGFVVLAKLVVTARRIGSVWARVVGEVGVTTSNLAGLAADSDGVYLSGTLNAGVVHGLRFQSCPFAQALSECGLGGLWYSAAAMECILQPNHARAPNQVCAAVYAQTLDRHLVAPTLPGYSAELGSLFVAAYSGGGVLRWHRTALGGSLSGRAMALIPHERGQFGLGAAMLYVAGQVERVEDEGGTVSYSDFGQVRFPPVCSPGLPGWCHGKVTGMSVTRSDIFLAQYAAADGELRWVRRLGQRDGSEEVRGMTAVAERSSVVVVGTFWGAGASAEDVFGLVAAGRGRILGCAIVDGPTWDSEQGRWVYGQLETEGLPDCLLRPLGQDMTGATGFVVEVGEGDGVVSMPGGRGLPYALCDEEGEEGCNAEGVVWARTIGGAAGGVAAAAQSYGAAVRGWRGGLAVAGQFSGVLRGARGSRGLTVQGVDDQGVYNNGEENSESSVIMLKS